MTFRSVNGFTCTLFPVANGTEPTSWNQQWDQCTLFSESKPYSLTGTVWFPNKWILWANSFQWIQTKQCSQNSLTSEGMTRHLFSKCLWFTKNNQIIKQAQLTNQCIWIKRSHAKDTHAFFFTYISQSACCLTQTHKGRMISWDK